MRRAGHLAMLAFVLASAAPAAAQTTSTSTPVDGRYREFGDAGGFRAATAGRAPV